MIYIEYELYKSKYQESYENYDKLLNEKEELFRITQPKAVDTTKENVSGGSNVNSFDEYLIKKEKTQLEERLQESLSILKDREMLLKLKKEELLQSKDWNDIIYTYSYIKHMSSRKIERRIPFSKSEICRKLKLIEKNTLGTNRDKNSNILV